jgi:hypothetical protein
MLRSILNLFGFLIAIVEYTPELFDNLQELVMRAPATRNLEYWPFVDDYYASLDWFRSAHQVSSPSQPEQLWDNADGRSKGSQRVSSAAPHACSLPR